MNKYCVYIHIRLDTKTPFYVGKGLEKRAKDKFSRNKYWHNIVNKAGFVIRILKKDLSEQKAFEIEKKLIKSYRKFEWASANLTDGGEGSSGIKISSETREKMRQSRIGKVASEDTKKRMSLSRKGHITTDKTKQKISNSNKGKKRSEQFKNNCRVLYKGRKISVENLKNLILINKKPVINIKTQVIYDSVNEASKIEGVPSSTISEHCNNKRKHIKYSFYVSVKE